MQSILNPKLKNSTATRQDTARHSRDFLTDTSSNKINTFKGTAFGLSSFFAFDFVELYWNFPILLSHKIQRFGSLFGSIIIITKKPILANRLLSLFAERSGCKIVVL